MILYKHDHYVSPKPVISWIKNVAKRPLLDPSEWLSYDTEGRKLVEDSSGSIIIECWLGRDGSEAIHYQITSESLKSGSSAWVKRFKYE